MQAYKNKADELDLYNTRYWNLLLHMVDGKSEIDDSNFFLAEDGKTNAKDELYATLDALSNETKFDDNSTACKFPARKAWLQKQLTVDTFPEVNCKEYNETLKKLDPKSVTLVFPSAHINSPASMFGHTFLRINSSYKSRLLSHAINYAADANPDETNAVAFAVKGLFGAYYGRYSLLPYYEKLKEYRDTEQRDIWEYDLDLTQEEVVTMIRHIWELNGTHSDYFFFTENCSYNMLWLIEIARESIHLREYFNYHIIPLETVHAVKLENIIISDNYRPSKRTILLQYEELLDKNYLSFPKALVNSKIALQDIMNDKDIDMEQKKYILEASTEYLQYSFSKNDVDKDIYLELFHNISKARASLGQGKKLNIEIPPNPLFSHRAMLTTAGFGFRDGENIGFLGIRPAYHSLEDSNYGFLRGTQIEFLNLLLSQTNKKSKLEEATMISIVSLAQRSEFFDSLSWRTKFGWDNNFLSERSNFSGSIGAGYSWGNKLAYLYFMVDPLFYYHKKFISAIGGSIGLVVDKYNFMNTNMEITKRLYESGDGQLLAKISQNFRLSQNLQLKIKYNYKQKIYLNNLVNEETYRLVLNYYF